jgi:hypothetical protein
MPLRARSYRFAGTGLRSTVVCHDHDVFTAMSPLPLRPEFPTFGLSDSFAGFRWLLLWQRRNGPWDGDVTEVSLGDGHPDDGPFVVVDTVLKQAERVLGGGASIGDVGVEYVASTAVSNAVEQAALDGHHARAMAEQELKQIYETDGEAALIGWQAEPVSIGGIAYPGQARHIGHSKAIVIELPTLVIGVGGPTGSLPEHCELVDVSGRLGDYAAGRNEWADSLFR